jgi:Holliday junction resolvase-like predicted endonuclease
LPKPSPRSCFASKVIASSPGATPVGEIDLVALRGKRLAFVEVKAAQDLR